MEVREASARYQVTSEYKQTEVGLIPVDWEVSLLVGLAEIRSGIAKNSNVTVSNPVVVHYLRVANVQNGFLDLAELSQLRVCRDDVKRYAVIPGDMLMNEGGDLDKLGRGALWSGEFDPCIHQNHVFVVRCGSKLLPKYLNAWTGASPARRFFLLAGRQTTNLASINKTSLGQFPVPLPPTKAEQEAIAEALSDADALIESLEQLIAKKRQIKQGAMQELLIGRKRLPGFSEEWVTTRLGTCLRFQVGFPFSSMFFNDDGQGIRLVRNRDLKSDDQVFFYSGKYDEAFSVRNGDVLVGMDGDFRPCLWTKGPALLNQRVGRVSPLKGLVGIFAYYFLIKPLKEIEDATSSTTVKHLSHGDIENIERPLPAIDEQTAIATVLSDMDTEIADLETRLSKARQLKQGMMQVLLTGAIRLPIGEGV